VYYTPQEFETMSLELIGIYSHALLYFIENIHTKSSRRDQSHKLKTSLEELSIRCSTLLNNQYGIIPKKKNMLKINSIFHKEPE
jgi:hypothetical protein